LFNDKTGFFQPKDDKGSWMEPFNPMKYGANGGNPFTEGNAWQYYWYVPQHVADLITLTGGDKAFSKKLDTFFSLNNLETEKNDNASGFIGQYAHGNEPSHHVAYLYTYAGAPYKTQERVREILDTLYDNAPDGLSGNEDCGQMSAWYAISALGFYAVDPAGGNYVFGTPLFEKAVIEMGGGHKLMIQAKRKSATDKYVQSVTLNGKAYDKVWFPHSAVAKGGTLVFTMGAQPNRTFGAAESAAPPPLAR
jgi:predicted alpha-1,2-mannosidase